MKAKPKSSAKTKPKAGAKSKASPKPKPKSKTAMSANIKLQVWFNARDGRIRLVSPGNFITTVTDQEGARCHRHLFTKLRTLLKTRGKWFELA